MKSSKKAIPQFKSLDEEMAFWAKNSPLDFRHRVVTSTEMSKASRRRKMNAVVLQLPDQDLKRLKKAAAAHGVRHCK